MANILSCHRIAVEATFYAHNVL